jgi:mannose-1-phosphate guanylyltransferase
VITTVEQAPGVANQLPDLPAENLIVEPCGRDTAPCIALGASIVSHRDPEGTMVVLPADHVITPDEAFHRAVRAGAAVIEREPEALVTFGIPPTHAATTFGYVERGGSLDPVEGVGIFAVKTFREKPDREQAEAFLATGRFYWNSGIFLWRAARVLDLLAEFEPEIIAGLAPIRKALDGTNAGDGDAAFEAVLAQHYGLLPRISIDYAVMERATGVYVLEAPYTWDDLGSWGAFARLLGSDPSGNAVSALHCGLDTEGSIVRAPDGHLVATLGVRDLIVVATPDATLVANKHDEDAIKQLVQLLREQGLDRYL